MNIQKNLSEALSNVSGYGADFVTGMMIGWATSRGLDLGADALEVHPSDEERWAEEIYIAVHKWLRREHEEDLRSAWVAEINWEEGDLDQAVELLRKLEG